MDYSVFKFGVLYLGTKAQPVPRRPMLVGGDVPPYDGSTISVGPLKNGEKITWVKPNGLNILIADRVLLANVSWEDLNQNGFIAGRPVLIDRQYFRCRLLQVGEKVNVPNEWDATLDETGENNALWHWNTMYFWGADVPANGTPTRVVRGRCSARHFDYISAAGQYSNLGFRPILEPLLSDNPTPNINLDGINFQLNNLPRTDAIYPILQPTQENVFADIPGGGKVRMYTFMEDGRPIHMDEPVKDLSKLTLTDRYYGDEYLVSWVISNGVAVAAKSLVYRV